MITDPFAQHAKALSMRAERTEVLANNIANADTPGFKARDFDFQLAMAGQQLNSPLRLSTTQVNHMPINDTLFESRVSLAYRTPSQPSVDGNTVETDIEQAQYADNVIGYQASLTFINRKISGLQMAIRGSI